MSNFDKLYNKRIDWKPIVAANKEKFLEEPKVNNYGSNVFK